MTSEGLPLGYRVYPGNRYEGHTLLEAVQSLAKEGFTESITVVADAGLCNRENRALLRQHGYHYVLGRGVKRLPEHWHEQLFDRNNYTTLTRPEQRELKMLELPDGDSKIIVTHSEKRAHHDAEQRAKLLAKLRKQVGNKASSKGLIPKHKAKFLQFDRTSRAEINEDAVAKDAQFDGLHAIITNRSNPLPALDIIAKYRELWQIEDCFRTNKHDLKIRPVYHWKDRRIDAHLMICFMAFCCLQRTPLPPTNARDLAHPARITRPAGATPLGDLAFETRQTTARRHHATAFEQNERHPTSRRSALAEAQFRPADDEQTGLDASKMPKFVVTKLPLFYYTSVLIETSEIVAVTAPR